MATKFKIIYWRDIPAQVKVQRGRRDRSGRELPARFQVAIDEAAMRAGITATDDYLNEWRSSDWEERDAELEKLAEEIAARLEAEYPPDRLRAIVRNGGREAR